MSTQLTFFTVTGRFEAIGEPNPAGNLSFPTVQPVQALITFTPRLPAGTPLLVSDFQISEHVSGDTAISLPALTARSWDGVLSTIDYVDTAGFGLVANTAAMNIDGDLVYEVSFEKVTFNGTEQFLAPFTFVAPTDATPVSITGMALPHGFTATIDYAGTQMPIVHSLEQAVWNRPAQGARRAQVHRRPVGNLPTQTRRGGRL